MLVIEKVEISFPTVQRYGENMARTIPKIRVL